jgi:hypothetical protein
MADADNTTPDVLKDLTIIKPIRLDDAHGAWVFEPRPDITALEAVLISHMFDAIAIRHLHGKFNRWDWREYLTRDRSTSTPPGKFLDLGPNLARHFKPVE